MDGYIARMSGVYSRGMDATDKHHLRNSISAILSASQSLLDEFPATSNDPRLLLHAIQRSCHSMLRLIDETREVAGRKRSRSEFTSTDLLSLVQQRFALKLSAARNRKVDLELVTDFERPAIQLDGSEIEVLLDEWISNALKLARPGTKVEVLVRVKAGQLIMSVCNTPAGELQPGAASKRERKKGPSATTIDRSVLSVVTRAVESHKGRLQVESRSGMGPRLTIRLPLTRFNAPGRMVPPGNDTLKAPHR